MWCTVHVLYRDGRRLPAEAAKAGGVYGWLHMYSKTPGIGMPKSDAFLLPGPEADFAHALIPALELCSLRAIAGGGIRLGGIDPHTHYEPMFHQSWWIIPGQRQP